MSISQKTEAMQLIDSYNQARDLFRDALLAIRQAEHDGLITSEIKKVRVEHLTERFRATRDVNIQIAACSAMLKHCENDRK